MHHQQQLILLLERLVTQGGLKAVLLVDKAGECLASHGDSECMERVAETHFKHGLNLAALSRDANGSTVLSDCSAEAVRFESIAGGRCILTLVSADPMAPARIRSAIDVTKRGIEALLGKLEL